MLSDTSYQTTGEYCMLLGSSLYCNPQTNVIVENSLAASTLHLPRKTLHISLSTLRLLFFLEYITSEAFEREVKTVIGVL